MSDDEQVMDSGVRVVGAPPEEVVDGGASDTAPSTGADAPPTRRHPGPRPTASGPSKLLFRLVAGLAVLGVVGTVVFGVLWGTKGGGSSGTNPAMVSAARTFLTDLTNFDAKSIDNDFGSITSMATGSFSSQANKFFNSQIRSELETALAESRGQIRQVYVQSQSATQGVIYAVVDQVYVNNKITTPQSDVLRVLVNLQEVGSTWKIADVTVLEGATPASTGSASGSAGSTVPGQ
jgi:hypothetical protein